MKNYINIDFIRFKPTFTLKKNTFILTLKSVIITQYTQQTEQIHHFLSSKKNDKKYLTSTPKPVKQSKNGIFKCENKQ